MTPETQGFQLLWGLSWGLAETPTLSRGSPRAGPRSPRGAGPHCTVTACLVLTRQVNSIPPLLSPFFPPFLPFVFCPPLSLSPSPLPLSLPPPAPPFLFFHRRSSFHTYSVFLLLTSWSLLRRRRRVSQTSNGRRLFLYGIRVYILCKMCGEMCSFSGGEFLRIFGGRFFGGERWRLAGRQVEGRGLVDS